MSDWSRTVEGWPVAGQDAALTMPGCEFIDARELRRRILGAAAALPRSGRVLNLCENRSNFLIIFAAAMLCRRAVLLPPSGSAATIAELRTRYPDAAIVDDSFTPAAFVGSPHIPSGEADFVAAVGHTSGSTGVPAAHAKTFASLRATTALNAATLRAELDRQGATDRPWIVATVPPQHMYGLETSILLPLLAGFGVHGSKPLMPADVAAALAEVPPPRVLVSTPVHLRAIADSGASFPALSIVLSATAPLSRDLATRIEERLDATLIELFGSTETCVIATRRTARGDMWRPYCGIRMVAHADGTIIAAPWLAQDQHLHDVVELNDDGTFAVVGRGTDIVEVAGKRGSLADLTQRMRSIDGVEDAVVFQPLVAEGGAAARCAALVVAPGKTPQEIARAMRERVDSAFVPRPIVIVTALPRNEVGKLPRERLIEALATSASRPRHGR